MKPRARPGGGGSRNQRLAGTGGARLCAPPRALQRRAPGHHDLDLARVETDPDTDPEIRHHGDRGALAAERLRSAVEEGEKAITVAATPDRRKRSIAARILTLCSWSRLAHASWPDHSSMAVEADDVTEEHRSRGSAPKLLQCRPDVSALVNSIRSNS